MTAKKKVWLIRLEFEIPDSKWHHWIDIKGGVDAILNLAGLSYIWHIDRRG